MEKEWLSESAWRAVQQRIPITCVDVLPVRGKTADSYEVGLILRDTPHQGQRWCLIGGRLLLNESLRSAAIRQIREALGSSVSCILEKSPQPLWVAQYVPEEHAGYPFDPRQHAIGLTFPVRLNGTACPTGEALDFQWFNVKQLPKKSSVGFGQERTILECVRLLSEEQ
jgi:ADP-ribose pyrophosphatase YjhB (NUDIX family)